jgi:hypothetical protein
VSKSVVSLLFIIFVFQNSEYYAEFGKFANL